MPRISPVTEPNERQQAQFQAIKASLGGVPNIFKHMGRAPALLDGYLGLSKSLSSGRLNAVEREALALSLAGRNGCDYCAAAHTASAGVEGLSVEAILDARRGAAVDPREQAALDFARAVLEQRGRVSDAELARVRSSGYADGDIAEIVANVAHAIYTNYFNNVAGTDIDFPRVAELAA